MANNRDKLIQASALLFMKYGFHGTSLDVILKSADVARSNFYYHFDSKDSLAVAVTDFWIEDYDTNLIEPVMTSGLSAMDTLIQLYTRASRTQGDSGDLIGCPLGRLSSELAAEMPPVQDRLNRYFNSVQERICAVLLDDDSIDIDSAKAKRFARLAVATLEGGLLLSGLRSNPDDVLQPGLTLVEVFKTSLTG